jgi:hypothetical protein
MPQLIKRHSYTPLVFLIAAFSCQDRESEQLSGKQFADVLLQISDGWNRGNARMAADVFAVDAIYEEPPRKQYYAGQAAIFEFFGGEKGFDIPMKMKWHNVAFDEDAQVGFGEYTFAMNKQYHGIVVVKIKKKKIARWREYQYESPMEWSIFSGEGDIAK